MMHRLPGSLSPRAQEEALKHFRRRARFERKVRAITSDAVMVLIVMALVALAIRFVFWSVGR